MGREGGVRGGVLPALLALLGALPTASLGANVTYDHRALVIDDVAGQIERRRFRCDRDLRFLKSTLTISRLAN
ncbi:hypothetical protein Nepgr_009608 [Nepenthes gracilis]|uniref:Uncharacterized protein n=1 Tax=Nepenthes gracilis TaxID=150966 RepID=A0AAD3XKA8_NEPGR|nr:hypothetical protein Nepgr_009608 [Nepenthes gracilis]